MWELKNHGLFVCSFFEHKYVGNSVTVNCFWGWGKVSEIFIASWTLNDELLQEIWIEWHGLLVIWSAFWGKMIEKENSTYCWNFLLWISAIWLKPLIFQPWYILLLLCRANAQQPKLFVGMILILIFAEALALYGLIVGIILSSRAGQSRAEWEVTPSQCILSER